MPELPEAEITKQKIQSLVGKTIYSFWTNLEKNLKITSYLKTKKDILNRKIKKINRWGKVILIHLQPKNKKDLPKILAIHQKMSGRLIIIKPNQDKPTLKYIHFIIKFKDGTALYFEDQRKFGIVWYGEKEKLLNDKYFKNLGPDALNIDFKYFKKQILKHKGQIKTVLLNQKFLAGIGNILADEILWLSKIHPQTKIQNLTYNQINKIWQSSQKIIQKSIKSGGASMRNWLHPDQTAGRFQNKTYVYGRQNKNCLRCKNKIIKIKIAGRGTYICSQCQKI